MTTPSGDAAILEPPLAGARPRFADHPLRSQVLGEIHARPFPVISSPRLIVHYAFMTGPDEAAKARDDLRRQCSKVGVSGPEGTANQLVVELRGRRLRWETHSEFTTYTWDMARPASDDAPLPADLFGDDFTPPGPLMVALRLDLVDDPGPTEQLLRPLDPGSMAVAAMRDGRALGATDFKQSADGLTQILLVNRGLFPQEIGPLVQRLVELETYRTMAMMGLPEARRLQPELDRLEEGLRVCTEEISSSTGLDANRAMLDQLTQLAAELEASAAASAYRFAATRAYAEIVRLRLTATREAPVEGYSRWSSFLERRMAPAMRTCASVEARQVDLSQRLERAATLLRTRIEVELEQQNRSLLATMNARARLQLRLQQWVEGLSVAAVSYYVVGLISYIAHGVQAADEDIKAEWISAFAVVPVVILIWLFVRAIRARHGHDESEEG